MGKVRHRTIKQFFCSNSDQSWNIKKKMKNWKPGSSILYYLQSDWTLLSEFPLSFLFHHSHFSPIANHISHCYFPSCSLFHHSYPSNDPFPPVLLFCCRSFQMPLHWATSLGPESFLWRGTCSCWWLESSQRAPHSPSYAAGGCWVMVSAKSSKRPWLPVQYLKAAPACWKTDLKEEGCSPWPQSNDISSSVREMLTEGSVPSQMRDFWLVEMCLHQSPPLQQEVGHTIRGSCLPTARGECTVFQSAHKKSCQGGQREGTGRTASSPVLCVKNQG